MTKPPDETNPEGGPVKLSGLSLRDELLWDLSGGECLPLGHIDSVVAYDHPTEPLTTRQLRVMTTIESLLNDGLLVIGDVVGGRDDYVEPWKMSTEKALARVREEYVVHYDNKAGWNWTTWFALTSEGERVAEEMSS